MAELCTLLFSPSRLVFTLCNMNMYGKFLWKVGNIIHDIYVDPLYDPRNKLLNDIPYFSSCRLAK